MIDTEEKVKIESRCGIECSKCEFQKTVACQGCVKIEKPFYGECAVKKCAESKGYNFCGECSQFPCDLLKSYSYDEENGDDGLRIEMCKKWCSKCK